ncbi:hypothetical protein AVEN_248970-1 [Araneus ventricosus]|uniref:Uncharacterized protein n=1 Tax=Araneus ventricosus TaxID=182803 RepID=A0A4Y2J6W2_ARAVE|nr:hypothetical protein AVEN_248970-1 [Araneus ventricosus]
MRVLEARRIFLKQANSLVHPFYKSKLSYEKIKKRHVVLPSLGKDRTYLAKKDPSTLPEGPFRPIVAINLKEKAQSLSLDPRSDKPQISSAVRVTSRHGNR